ncbi:helix-turn-helix transcriptional regulator [Arthrobacter sp. H35-D1]|uniref:helix-turn-helix domain-containing protein n=1 Tax=Arthrobacter sp. H35-D1 TaxID=3046202 RepID=UPI0024BA4BC9|nr:helix-turn-helix transcriptional regulator [Arthrobacter sp. H35-D1]MDJ0314197.1 helix-turn-helix transcriptional regulator [Arthrobacter sp. H35-D1]
MTKRVETIWNLRRLMADQGLFKTTELIPLLAEFGVSLSREQVFRLVTQTPERANLNFIGAVCAALNCTASDLIEVRVVEEKAVATPVEQTRTTIGNLRPRPARIHRPQQDPGHK